MAKVARLIRYELIDPPVYKLAYGCGEVYKAQDLLLRRTVATKIIGDAFLAAGKQAARKAFANEAKVQARLHELTDKIVAVYDLGLTDDDNLYYVMEWMGGGTADQDRGKVGDVRARQIVSQAIAALQVAHRESVVHGDVAPANLLCDDTRRTYKLADFGMARYLKPGIVSHISSPGFSSQRIDFIPREQMNKPGTSTFATDVFSLAATYFALIVGDPLPRRGDGLHYVPGVIRIQAEGKVGGSRLRKFFVEYIEGHNESQTIEQFKRDFEQLG